MSLVSIGLGFVMFLVLFVKPSSVYVLEFLLVNLGGKDIYYVIFWDFFSWLFVLCVLLIASMVFVYTIYYMDGDSFRNGFMLLLLSFVISMMFLLISPNFISLLLGWDGLGVTSYLLVIYYSSASSSVAGMLTFLTNRLGDIFFLLAIGVMAFFFDWDKISGLFCMMSFFIVVAAATKSAQVPFSSWLPAAMAAPTPVSSLVHSSTLVTAGVYLIIRFHTLLMKISQVLFFLGSMTLVVAGVMALFEWDLKKLIAFSTLSQLGFMVSAFGLGLVWLSFFHLITHALFKASLFLSAGILIHNADSSQEFRNTFSVPFQLFWVASVINICLICLCGVPFTSGFFSKDLIIDGGGDSFFFWGIYLVGVLFTVGYSFRFFSYTSWRFSLRSPYTIFYEKVWFIFLPLCSLLVAALTGGWLMFESFFSYLFFVILSPGWKVVYFFLLLSTFMVSLGISKKKTFLHIKMFFFSTLMFLKIFFSSKLGGVFKESIKSHKSVDQGSLEKLGPQGVFLGLLSWSQVLFSLQSFFVISFLVLFLLSFLVI